MKTVMRVVLGVALASGCAKRVETAGGAVQGARAADYYPLAVGNRWTYDARFLGEERRTEVQIVQEADGFFVDSAGGKLRADAHGIRDDKRYLLREPLQPGHTWTNVLSPESVERYRVVDSGVRCEAPAGAFEGCVRVEGRNRVDAQTTLVNELTFAPGVGLVRVRVTAQSGTRVIPQTELALREYTVQGEQNVR